MARDDVILAEVAEAASRAHLATLPGLVERALADAGLTIRDVEGVAVSIGPGSFTGLRIGLGLAKGIRVISKEQILAAANPPVAELRKAA